MSAPDDQERHRLLDPDAPADVLVREGNYGEQVITVEPGGAEFIPLPERHGHPLQLFWTWTSPNLEFATVFVGVLGVAVFGLGFWQAALAIVLGTGLGCDHAGRPVDARALARGATDGAVPARLRVLGQRAPAGLNAGHRGDRLVRGEQRERHVRAEHAHRTCPSRSAWSSSSWLQIVIAFFGHNLVQAFERYAFPVLAIIFVIATIVIFTKSQPGRCLSTAAVSAGSCSPSVRPTATRSGGTRTPPTTPDTSRPSRAGRPSAVVRARRIRVLRGPGDGRGRVGHRGQRRRRARRPHRTFTGHLPTALADLTLLAIALGAIAANVLNIYSGAMSFVAMGIKLPLALRRAIVALVFGVIGFIVAFTGLHDAGTKYDELPADHRVLDRALAGRGVLRPVAAPRQASRGRELLFDKATGTGRGRWR